MSFFIGSSSQYSQALVDPAKLNLAEIQYDAMATTFNKVLTTCQEKCIPSEYGENELNKGETCCVDRCVAKYVKANLLIGQSVQSKGLAPENMPEYKRYH